MSIKPLQGFGDATFVTGFRSCPSDLVRGDGALAQVLCRSFCCSLAGTFFFPMPALQDGRAMRPSLLGYGVPDRCPVCGLTIKTVVRPVPPGSATA